MTPTEQGITCARSSSGSHSRKKAASVAGLRATTPDATSAATPLAAPLQRRSPWLFYGFSDTRAGCRRSIRMCLVAPASVRHGHGVACEIMRMLLRMLLRDERTLLRD